MGVVERTRPLLKKVLQTFKPCELIKYNSENNKIIIECIIDLIKFSIDELSRKVDEDIKNLNKLYNDLNISRKYYLDKRYIESILDRLRDKGILNFDGSRYILEEEYKEFLKEFFGYVHATTVRTGLLRYILLSKKRILLWAVINIDQSCFDKESIESVIEKSFKYDSRLYNKLYKKYGIRQDENIFIINNKDETYEKILDDILRGYYSWQLMRTRGEIRQLIIGLMMHYKEISGKEIIKELKFQGYEFDKSLVYYHLRKLKEEGYIENVKRTDTRGREEYYMLKPDVIEKPSKEELRKRLESILDYFGINNRQKFINEVLTKINNNKLSLPELNTFCEQLDVLRNNVSSNLWELLLEYLGDEFKNGTTLISTIINTIINLYTRR